MVTKNSFWSQYSLISLVQIVCGEQQQRLREPDCSSCGPDSAHKFARVPFRAPYDITFLFSDVDELDAAARLYPEVPDAFPYPEAPASLPYPEAPATLPVPYMMALVMSQLQPVLEGFNRSLEHLSRQVGELARDVAHLKSSQLVAEPQARPLDGPELDEASEERLDAKLDEVFQHIREVRNQMESQRTDMENRLHSQHAMLHYNLTSFKTDVDMKLKRHQKMLQVK